jgi:hypothetical protein
MVRLLQRAASSYQGADGREASLPLSGSILELRQSLVVARLPSTAFRHQPLMQARSLGLF